MMTLYLSGVPRVVQPHGGDAKPLDRKSSALALLAAAERRCTRDRAGALLWPASSASAARTNIRVVAHRLFERLGTRIFAEGELLLFSDSVRVDLLEARREGLTLEIAMDLLREPLLGRFAFEDCPEFLEILDAQRVFWKGEARRVAHAQVQTLLGQATEEGRSSAVSLLHAILESDPADEPASRWLMLELLRTGDRVSALAAYERLRKVLADQLGVRPETQTEQVHRRVLSERLLPESASDRLAVVGGESEGPGPFVERIEVLQRMWQSVQSHEHLLIEGDAGIGKTRILQEFLASRLRHISVASRRDDDERPFATLRRFVDAASAVLPLSGSSNPLRYFEPKDPRADPDIADRPLQTPGVVRALVAYWRLLRQAGIEVLVFDDLHWIDRRSAQVFFEALTEILGDGPEVSPKDEAQSAVPIFVLSRRPNDQPDFLTEYTHPSGDLRRLGRILIPPLTPAGIRELLDRLGAPWSLADATLAPRLFEHTGGNPFFVLEVLREARWAGAFDLKSVPRVIAALFHARISSLGASALKLLEVAHCAGLDFVPGMAEHVVRWRATELTHAWSELTRCGIFGHDGFAHDLARQAASSALAGPRRAALHLKIAEYLAPDALPERVAHHLLLAERPERALAFANRAARRQLFAESLAEEPLALLRWTLSKLPRALADDHAALRFQALGIAGSCCHVLGRTEEELENAQVMQAFAQTDDEKVIAACKHADALYVNMRALDAIAVCEAAGQFTGSRWGWALRVATARSLAFLDRLDEAAAMLPGLPTDEDLLCRHWGFHAYSALIRTNLMMGRLAAAITVIDRIAAQGAASWGTNYERGGIYDEMGDFTQAQAFFQAVVDELRFEQRSSTYFSHELPVRILTFEIAQDRLEQAALKLESIDSTGMPEQVLAMLLAQRCVLSRRLGDHFAFEAELVRADQVDSAKYPQSRLIIEASRVLHLWSEGSTEQASEAYERGLAYATLPDSTSKAYRLLGCRFLAPQAALQYARAILKSRWDAERRGLLLIARTEEAAALARLGARQEAAQIIAQLRPALEVTCPPLITRQDLEIRIVDDIARVTEALAS